MQGDVFRVGGIEYTTARMPPGYAVSRCGLVVSSLKRKAGSEPLETTWRPRKQFTTPKGYRSIGLRVDGRTLTERVHRLVLLAWVGPPPPGKPHCRHLDGNPGNNHIDNLAWGSPLENAADAMSHGTLVKGEDNSAAKLTEPNVREIRRLASLGLEYTEIARRFGVSDVAIGLVVRRKVWAWLTD